MYVGIYGEYQLLCEILIKLDCIDRFWRNTQILNFTKIRPVSPVISCRRTDGRTDMTTLTVAFRNFPIAHKYTFL